MNTSEVLDYYKSGVKVFKGIHIVGSLAGENLEGIEFEDCSLLVNFKGANLQGAVFKKGHIKNANFIEADLSNAKFENMTIDTANFKDAKTDGIQFRFNRYAGSYASQEDFDSRLRLV